MHTALDLLLEGSFRGFCSEGSPKLSFATSLTTYLIEFLLPRGTLCMCVGGGGCMFSCFCVSLYMGNLPVCECMYMETRSQCLIFSSVIICLCLCHCCCCWQSFSLKLINWLVSELQESTYVCLPTAGLYRHSLMCLGLYLDPRDLNSALHAYAQAFDWVGYFPSP